MVMDYLYYGDSQCQCGNHHGADFHNDVGVTVGLDVLGAFMRKIYGGFDARNEVEHTLWHEVLRIINEGTVEGLLQAKSVSSVLNPPTHDDEFYRALRHSNEVFAAFKVHDMGVHMAQRLLDADGKLKPFRQWAEDVKDITTHHVGSWLKTEYDTAVLRAHAAADWREFERNKDVMPNLRWVKTTSPNPEGSHRQYWEKGLVLPVDDPFWDEHHPGDRWNCKCSLEQTDDPVTMPDDMEPTPPQRGLENNPGKDGHTFNDTHPYFPDSCSHCFAYRNSGLKNRLKVLFLDRAKDCYNCPYIDGCSPGNKTVRERVAEHLRNLREHLDKYQGATVDNENFLTGQMRVLRRTLDDIIEHGREDAKLMQWMSSFSLQDLRKMEYKGWAENRAYEPGHPKYDPLNPQKKKHPETDYFLYYSLNIDGKTFWANVKMHNDYNGEVLYTIEKNKPIDLIEGKPKK